MMLKYIKPDRIVWPDLLRRPSQNAKTLTSTVQAIVEAVALNGDTALRQYTRTFDNIDLEDIAVTAREIEEAVQSVAQELKDAIDVALTNIESFHQSQAMVEPPLETMPGVKCWRKSIPVQRVGLYIPGGTAPLFSSVLMLGIPARIAGCQEVVMCTPARADGTVDPTILYTAQLVGVKRIYKVGGAQAIAAMAHGTETIPKVDKIFGPGNQYVTKAKELVQQTNTAIDMPAGPSELLVIADRTSRPDFVAADLLSQAEHGIDSQVILLSDDDSILDACLAEMSSQIADLPRRDIATRSIASSKAILLSNLDECIEMSNGYAPEHLIIASDRAASLADKVINAGSVFLGHYSCESAGDYASGTNHTLPTNGYASMCSGVSLDSFVKKITYQQITKVGIRGLGPSIEVMAAAEQLEAHKRAASIRLKSLEDER